MDRLYAVLRLIGVGFYIGGSIVLGVVFGMWLANKLDNAIWIIVGLFLGLIVAFWGVYQMLLPFIRGTRKRGDK